MFYIFAQLFSDWLKRGQGIPLLTSALSQLWFVFFLRHMKEIQPQLDI